MNGCLAFHAKWETIEPFHYPSVGCRMGRVSLLIVTHNQRSVAGFDRFMNGRNVPVDSGGLPWVGHSRKALQGWRRVWKFEHGGFEGSIFVQKTFEAAKEEES